MGKQYICKLTEVSATVLEEKLQYLIETEGDSVVSVTRVSPFQRVESQQRYVDDMLVADYLIVADEPDD